MMKSYTCLRTFLCVSAFSFLNNVTAQENKITLSVENVIELAQTNSVQALIAKNNYLSKYWSFRSYKAQLVPSLWLTGSTPDFSRRLTKLQDWQTGEYNYVEDFYMQNQLAFSLQQNISATGGTVSLRTSLSRLDQYAPGRSITYNSMPVYVNIAQPIGGFNELKWDKKIEPIKYEQAKYEYLEAMGTIAETALSYFFQQLEAEQNLDMALRNRENGAALYEIAKERYEIGTMSKNQLLQLELGLINAGISITNSEIQLNLCRTRLRTFLGFSNDEEITLVIPETLSGIEIPMEKAYYLSLNNTSFTYNNRIRELEARKAVAKARAEQGLQVNLNADFGLNQVAPRIGDAYRNPSDQESVRLTLSIPILDGGMRKGRVRMSQSQEEVVQATIENDITEQRENLYLTVMQFNNQNAQCQVSRKADSIARIRFDLISRQFASGGISVTELNTAQSEKDNARNQLITSLRNYWNYYYTIRRYTLYDFTRQQNISELFDRTELEK